MFVPPPTGARGCNSSTLRQWVVVVRSSGCSAADPARRLCWVKSLKRRPLHFLFSFLVYSNRLLRKHCAKGGEATGGLLVGGIYHLCDGARDETTAAVWDQGPAASLCGALNKREQKGKNIS